MATESDRPPRPVTPYEKFTDVPRSITPPSMYAVSEPPASRPSTFTQEIRQALDHMEQSITENVKRVLHALGTTVIGKQDAIRKEIKQELDARDRRLALHAAELGVIRGAVEERTGVILPPPPDDL